MASEGSFRVVRYTGNRVLDFYIKQRAALYRSNSWRYTQPWFLRPDARQTAVSFGIGGNLFLVFVALPIGVNTVMDSKEGSAERRTTSFEHSSSVLEGHMVLALLNEKRAAAGLPPASHLLKEDTIHDSHKCKKAAALKDFDSLWERVEGQLASQPVQVER